MSDDSRQPSRRGFLRGALGVGATLALGGLGAATVGQARRREWVWQLDPDICIQCGQCATECVLNPSAVKCVQNYEICGYCDLCFGYFQPGITDLNTGAENLLCPAGAIERVFVEEPYYEYNIDEELCIGCGKCVKPCLAFGNGSFFLQVRHDRCINCNQCSIARKCPSNAYKRVPADKPYLLRGYDPDKVPLKTRRVR
ncbi:4Fe-4S binding protein [Candidatus Sumerlaeota bacterium]|nr:4Fe-4S binding protein [Candidatus Sumerlaeota bacterium]